MKISDKQINELLGNEGPFAKVRKNFKARSEQQTMSVAVNQAIQNQDNLIVEAGTGVGKTFAYLLPALLSEKQVVISTGTKNLQDQLFKRDLPTIMKVLQISPLTALLKGRSNYLCEYRLESTLASGRLPDPKAVKHLGMVNRWRDKTLSGDLSELSALPENSPVISYVTSTADNCLGQECPFIEKCFLAAAREKARKAKVLVVNHHLLLADLVLKEDGFGELLPDTDVFIVDEAHHLSRTAYQFYGDSISSRQIADLCREVELEYRTQVTDCRDLMLEAQRLNNEAKEFRLALPVFDTKEDWKPEPRIVDAVKKLSLKINSLYEIVKVNSTRTKTLESCFERLIGFRHTIEQFMAQTTGATSGQRGARRSENTSDDVAESTAVKPRINWYETMKSGFRLNTTPLDVDELFQQSRQRYANSSWIMTSATLSVDDSFDHYVQSLGWDDVKNLILPSSFDYENQSLLYVPRGLPSIRQSNRTQVIIDTILPLLQHATGRAFVLFTSHRALKEGAEALREMALFNCLVQGEASKEELLNQFHDLENAVLLATGSFWEGIDVAGDNLILVVIDKLPFAPPDDPILNAKIRQSRQQGGNPFFELQIPEAVLSLKQGCGRLIRSVEDRGVVCICDPRIVGKNYGEVFLNSLPAMRRTRDQQLVTQFLTDIILTSEKDEIEINEAEDDKSEKNTAAEKLSDVEEPALVESSESVN
ncbi:ATP-dependent DNA helicase [Aliikangiella coralliicola]|uniref:DNA 5'-3' helicase n=1 Tax=Aliikangiella coralliicola TaxID=2592383 RepID=A0A545U8J1_9GAMM|nr:ATP-dependent DNA helicase [Aliikangiella coralliicola]TQV85785.1 ATP-dependent DNA helicase [Aliikangiella coralliicola]